MSEHALDQVALSGLPEDVTATLALIWLNEPSPYPQDGSTFKNLERRLPLQPGGYYREYTVKTPGHSDRGPSRLVVGQRGELYYTEDHYNSFVEVIIDL